MEESNNRQDRDDKLEERRSDATSDETVSDLQESEKARSTPGDKSEPGPSPDGRLDEPDELKDAGPM